MIKMAKRKRVSELVSKIELKNVAIDKKFVISNLVKYSNNKTKQTYYQGSLVYYVIPSERRIESIDDFLIHAKNIDDLKKKLIKKYNLPISNLTLLQLEFLDILYHLDYASISYLKIYMYYNIERQYSRYKRTESLLASSIVKPLEQRKWIKKYQLEEDLKPIHKTVYSLTPLGKRRIEKVINFDYDDEKQKWLRRYRIDKLKKLKIHQWKEDLISK